MPFVFLAACGYNTTNRRIYSTNWVKFEHFIADFMKTRSLVFSGTTPVLYEDFHAGAQIGDKCDVLISAKEVDKIYKCVHQIPTKAIPHSISTDREGMQAYPSPNIFINGSGAPAGDVFKPVYDASGSVICNEVFQVKHVHSIVYSAKDIEAERTKAANAGDFFVFISSGIVNIEKPPVKTVVISEVNFDSYFGPFAGRAWRLWNRPYINTATTSQLEAVTGIDQVSSAAIVKERTKNGPFTSLDDACKRLPKLRRASLEAYLFD